MFYICGYLLKRQKMFMLLLMGFKLLFLAEILTTALMVALKTSKSEDKPVTVNHLMAKPLKTDIEITALDIVSPGGDEL